MDRLQVVMSHRCVFPKGAGFFSTKKIAEMARGVGYGGVEYLPTWRFVGEMWRWGELLASEKMVVAGHRDWRFDRVMEAELKGRPWWWYQLRNREDWLFPPSGMCLRSLRRFQERYGVPVSVMWFEDAKNFSPVMLELWSRKQGVDYEELLRWLEKGAGNRGVVIDTAKLPLWLLSNELAGRKRQVLKRLMPYVSEVHLRLKRKGRDAAVEPAWGRLGEDTWGNYWLMRELGWLGRVVVEAGWPDLDERVFGIWGENLERFAELHGRLMEVIRSG